MQKITRNLIALLVLIFPMVCFGQTSKEIRVPKRCSVSEGNLLERKDCNIDWKKETVSNILKHSLRDVFLITDVPAGISIAFERIGENEEIEQDLTPDSFALKDILNKIITTDSRYQWKEANGVINIFPIDDYGILEIRIPEFKVENAFTSEIRQKLIQTSEFQNYLRARNLVDKVDEGDMGFICCGFIGKPNPRSKISINLKNATVREILNEIVRQKVSWSSWTYREYELTYKGKIYNLYRLEP